MELLGLVDIPTWLLVLLVLVITAYIYHTWTFGAFNGYGLPGPKPYPFFGTTGSMFTKGMLQMDVDIMREYGKVVAMFQGRLPTIFTTDEDIIKAVCVKEVASFTDRLSIVSEEDISSDMLSLAKGDKWRRLRHLMSPTFSSGKLKKMNHQVNNCAKILTDNMEEYARTGKSLDVKLTAQAFTMDTIAATAFGLELNAQKDPNNKFVQMGRKAFEFSLFSPIIIILVFFPFLFPLLQKLKLGFIPKSVINFFSDLTDKVVAEREKSDTKQVDFLQLMMDAHKDMDAEQDVTYEAGTDDSQKPKQDRKGMTRRELNAQAVLFFIAGFETTAAAITFLCYNLAVHPDQQEKLYQEIKQHMKGKDTVEYGTLSQMPYLDQCVNESLRLYPPGFRTDRWCTQDITIKGISIKKYWSVVFPVYVMHHDPELWENPEEFIPERFEDMSKIGYKFMPFGMGPRNCIGMRLALMEVKIAMIHILNKFKLVRTEETLFPLKFDKIKFMQPVKPLKLGLEKRE